MINAIVVLLVIAVVGLGCVIINLRSTLTNEINTRIDRNDKIVKDIHSINKSLVEKKVFTPDTPEWSCSSYNANRAISLSRLRSELDGVLRYIRPDRPSHVSRDISLILDHLNLEVSNEPAKTVLREKEASDE